MAKNTVVAEQLMDLIKEIAEEAASEVDLDEKAERAVEEAIENTDIENAVEKALDEYDFDRKVEEAIENLDLNNAIKNHLDNMNFDNYLTAPAEEAVEEALLEALDLPEFQAKLLRLVGNMVLAKVKELTTQNVVVTTVFSWGSQVKGKVKEFFGKK